MIINSRSSIEQTDLGVEFTGAEMHGAPAWILGREAAVDYLTRDGFLQGLLESNQVNRVRNFILAVCRRPNSEVRRPRTKEFRNPKPEAGAGLCGEFREVEVSANAQEVTTVSRNISP